MHNRKAGPAFFLAAGLAASIFSAWPALADEPPPLALGPAPYDEIRSTGREIAPTRERPDPAKVPLVACSFRDALCVHAEAATAPAAILWTLRWAEQALRTYRGLGLPAPLDDAGLGGTRGFDIYLVAGEDGPSTTSDLIARGHGFDSQSAFTILPPPAAPYTSCFAPNAVAQGIARAILFRFDAAIEDGTSAMASTYLASLASECSLADLAAVDDFQRRPERALTIGSPDAPSGSLLFPWFLDDVYGQSTPARVVTTLISVAAQHTKPGAWEWSNEPDLFDTLRINMKARESSLDALLLDFAIHRAFVGSRSDGMHLTGVERFGDFGRVRFDWAVPFGSLPRRLAPTRPLDPTGATYLWIDCADAPPGAELTFLADWELPSIFRWSLIKVDKSGAENGRIDIAGVYGDSHVERSVVGLGGMAGLLIVGVNGGSTDRAHPFDPDEAPYMPHSYTVTLAK
ncbi:MAG: hypothetical protein ABJE95_31840 [Byssovorax sp.]